MHWSKLLPNAAPEYSVSGMFLSSFPALLQDGEFVPAPFSFLDYDLNYIPVMGWVLPRVAEI